VLGQAWAALGGDPALLPLVRVTGHAGLPSVLPVAALATGAVAAQQLAAAELTALDRPPGPVPVDAAHAGTAFRSERFLRLDGVPAGAGFAPLSRFHRAADGWVRLHANYPWHRAAALAALGPDPVAAIAARPGAEVAEAVVAAGGVAAAVRTPEQWAASPEGAAVRGSPLLRLRSAGPAPARLRRLPGLRVLDLTRVIAGPVGTRTLAAAGADVLRIESPRLPEDPATLLDTGLGKRLTPLDLASPGDRSRFEDLLARADVLVHGHRPGALDGFGLASGQLAERHPGLVVVSLSAWGAAGPWAARRGFDSIVQAATGIAAVTGADDGTPGVLPAQALDHAAGHLVAATVCRALTESARRGGSWHGELSLAQLAHWLLAAPRTPAGATPVDVDPTPYLADLDTPAGRLTVVRPPGAALWRDGPVLLDPAHADWLPR
jgi:crotonobetainyl-CoA:carnitine CoA-transferase CaiB-like acyl-CoA transferase